MGFAAESPLPSLQSVESPQPRLSVVSGTYAQLTITTQDFGCSVCAMFPRSGDFAFGSSAEEAVGLLSKRVWGKACRGTCPDISDFELGASIISHASFGEHPIKVEYINASDGE